jgi:hypothetical protein
VDARKHDKPILRPSDQHGPEHLLAFRPNFSRTAHVWGKLTLHPHTYLTHLHLAPFDATFAAVRLNVRGDARNISAKGLVYASVIWLSHPWDRGAASRPTDGTGPGVHRRYIQEAAVRRRGEAEAEAAPSRSTVIRKSYRYLRHKSVTYARGARSRAVSKGGRWERDGCSVRVECFSSIEMVHCMRLNPACMCGDEEGGVVMCMYPYLASWNKEMLTTMKCRRSKRVTLLLQLRGPRCHGDKRSGDAAHGITPVFR